MNPLITASEMTFGGFRCEACGYVERWPTTAIDRKLILHHTGRPCPKCHAPLLKHKEADALLRALRVQQLLNVIKLPIMILLLPVTLLRRARGKQSKRFALKLHSNGTLTMELKNNQCPKALREAA